MRHRLIASLILVILLGTGLLSTLPASAQIPDMPLIGFGQTIPGEVSTAAGNQHTFTGCAGEVVGLSVTANDFSSRVELYYAGDADPLATAAAPASSGTEGSTVVLEDVTLPAPGPYTILVKGRSRADRGGYSLTLLGEGADGGQLDDGASLLNLALDQVVTGTLLAARVDQWNFRGCEGDAIHAQLVAEGFTPSLRLYAPNAEHPIATAVADIESGVESSDGVTVELRRELPATGIYLLAAGGANRGEFGDYSLGLSRDSAAQPTATPTANATSTSTGGPRGRRGNPTARPNATPTRQATATPTPEFLMPGVGETAFTVIDVSSEGGPVNHVAYAPVDDRFATAGEDGMIRLWNPMRGELLQSMEGHKGRATYVAFAPAGDLLASAGDDGMVRLWDPATGAEVDEFTMPDNGVNSVAFSPDGTELVATSDSGDVLIWDVAQGEVRQELTGLEGPVYHALFSPDGAMVAAGDASGLVRIWDAADGALLHSLPVNRGPGGGDPILTVGFSSDSKTLVVGGVVGIEDASVQVWDLETEEETARLVGHSEWGSSASFSPDDAFILSGGRAEPGQADPASATARLWDAATGELRVALVGYPSSVIAATFRPDGEELLTSDGSTVYLWPAPMIDLFAATFAEPVGVQVPAPTEASTNTIEEELSPTPSSTLSPTPSPTLTPTATFTPTPSAPTVSLEIFCTVIADRLNLRPGPGTSFNPPVTVVETGEILVVTGRNADSSWLQVVVLDDALKPAFEGWVSADFVFCVGEIDDAPVMQ
jgi:WD40 repeat protein